MWAERQETYPCLAWTALIGAVKAELLEVGGQVTVGGEDAFGRAAGAGGETH